MRALLAVVLALGLLIVGPTSAIATGSLSQDLVAVWWMRSAGGAPEVLRQNFFASPSASGGKIVAAKNGIQGLVGTGSHLKTGTVGDRYGFVQRMPYTIVSRMSASGVPGTFASLGGFSSSSGATNDPFLYYLSAGNFQLGWRSGGTARNMTCTNMLLKPQILWGVVRPDIVTCGRDHVIGNSSVAAQATPNSDSTRIGWFANDANVSIEYVLLYARALAPSEIDYLVVNPYAWIPRGPSFVTTGLGGAPPSPFSPFLVVPD